MVHPNKKPIVKLIGHEGNSYVILYRVKEALMREGADKEYIDQYFKEAMSGDYNHLLTVSMAYAKVE